MRNLRKFSVFLLFIAVFGVLLYSLFPAALGDMAENLRSGGGTRTFIQAVQGADGVAYALEAEPGGGYTLYGTSAEGRVSTQSLSAGLPQDFSVEQIYVAKNGCILLGLYERAGVELTRYALYAALPEQPFQLLLEAPLSGITGDQRRASAGLLYVTADGELVELAVLQEGEYARYTFDPAQGQGLVAAGALGEEGFAPERCRSHISQKKGTLTLWEEAQLARGGFVWGCDRCGQACPHNADPLPTPLEEFSRGLVPVATRENLPLLVRTHACGWRGKGVLERNLKILEAAGSGPLPPDGGPYGNSST